MRSSIVAAVSGAALSLALLAPATFAQQGQQLAITIYNDNLALVQDKRDIEIATGRQRLEFPGVSGEIRPEPSTAIERSSLWCHV